ncbi:sulfite exporter TauE/SafE family protein [Thiobacillus sp.]|uniref:sulfite exporter TauE/SafE family protein n=1 Tax=Thiobacillus sp. TaxID=924 RepID=UPI0017A57476|nr:sulfite exporter TauE/SafE family protein [Thiobacillus sp.]MBC2729496.1 sulfite exporter TauE/SafE family protein [Thiobacillus sp.]MBC2738231.1 sulfite exporter TauE/SafE family protein [Thiobacillus sp.]MBC2761589.1 sulfite exporter TauE/SafE family protein [Thiobacillus sp.]
MIEFSLLTALLAGLLGGVHCVGMCGGIVAAFSFRADGSTPPFRLHLAYNLGRVLSYVLFGALAGALGASLKLAEFMPVQTVLYVLAQVVMILLGLYLAGLNRWVLMFERAGGSMWRGIKPLFQKLLPVKSLPQAVLAGMAWGWLPCGLVYSVLVSALAAGSATSGAALMLAFGLGTLPNLLGMGLFARQIQPFMQQLWVRRAAGLTVAGFGVWGLMTLGYAALSHA